MQPLAGLHQHATPRPGRHTRHCFRPNTVTLRGLVGCWESSPLAAGGVERRDSYPAGLALLLRVGGGFTEVGAVVGVAADDQLLGGVKGRAASPAAGDSRGGCWRDAQAFGSWGVPAYAS